MTNGWVDIRNADVVLVMGGNPAENHPCGFKWAVEAKRERNAKLVVVDPRFTRTASNADLFLQIRAGSDIAFLGALIRFVCDFFEFLVANHVDRDFDEVANHRFDVTADVTDFGKLRRFDFQEW